MASLSDCDGDSSLDEELTRDLESLNQILEGETTSKEQGCTDQTQNDEIDKSVERLSLCLQRNFELQSFLRQQIEKIDSALQVNKQKLESVSVSGKRGKASLPKPFTFWSFHRGKYFRDNCGRVPPNCSDLTDKCSSLVATQGAHSEAPWHMKSSGRKVLAGVRTQVLEKRSQPILSQLQKSVGCEESEQKLRQELESLKAMSNADLFKDLNPDDINWSSLAYEMFGRDRSSSDCRLHWVNHLNTSLNNGAWSKDEDCSLVKLAHKYKERNWVIVAQELGTNRSAFNCLKHYQCSKREMPGGGKWTADEDEKLKEAVSIYGERNWIKVSNYVSGGRSSVKCYHRWNMSICPDLKRGKWAPEEDKCLLEGVSVHGKTWSKVCQFVPGRNQSQCRERFINCLDSSLRKGPWEKYEDQLLLAACKPYEGKSIPWSKVAKKIPNRLDSMCSQRWRQLSSADAVINQYTRQALKRSLISSGRRNTNEKINSSVFEEIEESSLPDSIKKMLETVKKHYEGKVKRRNRGCEAHRNILPSPDSVLSSSTSHINDLLTSAQYQLLSDVPFDLIETFKDIPDDIITMVKQIVSHGDIDASPSNMDTSPSNMSSSASSSPVEWDTSLDNTLIKLLLSLKRSGGYKDRSPSLEESAPPTKKPRSRAPRKKSSAKNKKQSVGSEPSVDVQKSVQKSPRTYRKRSSRAAKTKTRRTNKRVLSTSSETSTSHTSSQQEVVSDSTSIQQPSDSQVAVCSTSNQEPVASNTSATSQQSPVCLTTTSQHTSLTQSLQLLPTTAVDSNSAIIVPLKLVSSKPADTSTPPEVIDLTLSPPGSPQTQTTSSSETPSTLPSPSILSLSGQPHNCLPSVSERVSPDTLGTINVCSSSTTDVTMTTDSLVCSEVQPDVAMDTGIDLLEMILSQYQDENSSVFNDATSLVGSQMMSSSVSTTANQNKDHSCVTCSSMLTATSSVTSDVTITMATQAEAIRPLPSSFHKPPSARPLPASLFHPPGNRPRNSTPIGSSLYRRNEHGKIVKVTNSSGRVNSNHQTRDNLQKVNDLLRPLFRQEGCFPIGPRFIVRPRTTVATASTCTSDKTGSLTSLESGLTSSESGLTSLETGLPSLETSFDLGSTNTLVSESLVDHTHLPTSYTNTRTTCFTSFSGLTSLNSSTCADNESISNYLDSFNDSLFNEFPVIETGQTSSASSQLFDSLTPSGPCAEPVAIATDNTTCSKSTTQSREPRIPTASSTAMSTHTSTACGTSIEQRQLDYMCLSGTDTTVRDCETIEVFVEEATTGFIALPEDSLMCERFQVDLRVVDGVTLINTEHSDSDSDCELTDIQSTSGKQYKTSTNDESLIPGLLNDTLLEGPTIDVQTNALEGPVTDVQTNALEGPIQTDSSVSTSSSKKFSELEKTLAAELLRFSPYPQYRSKVDRRKQQLQDVLFEMAGFDLPMYVTPEEATLMSHDAHVITYVPNNKWLEEYSDKNQTSAGVVSSNSTQTQVPVDVEDLISHHFTLSRALTPVSMPTLQELINIAVLREYQTAISIQSYYEYLVCREYLSSLSDRNGVNKPKNFQKDKATLNCNSSQKSRKGTSNSRSKKATGEADVPKQTRRKRKNVSPTLTASSDGAGQEENPVSDNLQKESENGGKMVTKRKTRQSRKASQDNASPSSSTLEPNSEQTDQSTSGKSTKGSLKTKKRRAPARPKQTTRKKRDAIALPHDTISPKTTTVASTNRNDCNADLPISQEGTPPTSGATENDTHTHAAGTNSKSTKTKRSIKRSCTSDPSGITASPAKRSKVTAS